MKRKLRKTTLIAILLISSFSLSYTGYSQTSAYKQVTSFGVIANWPLVNINVNINKQIDTNKLSLGFQLDYPNEWQAFLNRPGLQKLAKEANFRLVRIADRHMGPLDYSKGVGPCIYWNETSKTGTFNWTEVDSVVRAIFNIGAEPLICLSAWVKETAKPTVPPGMAVDPNTLLPYPDSYAAFAAAWVQHFKDVGLPVRYYEIFNEIQTYIGWNPSTANQTRIANFVRLFNAVYTKMHQINSQVMVSTDCSLEKHFFSYFVNYGVGLDFLDFHKYDAWKYPQFTDAEMFQRAETIYFTTDWNVYSIADARQMWYNKHGTWLPVILSETNFNAAAFPSNPGSDPRIQQMTGAVRTALLIRMGLLNRINYIVYHCFTSSLSYDSSLGTGGAGFGMINRDNDAPWYPYYVLKMYGQNLGPNAKIFQSSASDTTNFRTIAWSNNGKINIIIINKSQQDFNIKIQGVEGAITYQKIDESIHWKTPQVQAGQLGEYLFIKGYTVALIQASITTTPSMVIFEDNFESSNFSKWTGTTKTSGETATIASYRPFDGAYHARFSSNGDGFVEHAYLYKTINENEVYARGYFRIASGLPFQESDSRFYFLRLRANGESVGLAGIRQNGNQANWIILSKNGSRWVGPIYGNSVPIDMNRWYCVELHWKASTYQGVIELYIDGTKILSISDINTAYFGNADTLDFGLISDTNHPNKLIIYADSLKVSKSYVGTM
ncbi:MAG: hypothetical protein QXZ70_06360 [Candidatus Bathyarchaeia archaeon]